MRESITLANSSVKWIAWDQSIAPHPLSSKEERGSCRFLQPVYRKGHRLLFFGAMRPGAFLSFCIFSLKFSLFPSRRGRGFFFYPLYLLLNFSFIPSTRSGRAGPLLSGQQKVGKDWPKRAAPPLGFPLCGRAGAAFGRNSREESNGTPSRLRGRSFREICESFAAKAVSDVVPCAFAHDKRAFPFGECYLKRGGRGRKKAAPLQKRRFCGIIKMKRTTAHKSGCLTWNGGLRCPAYPAWPAG